MRAMPPRGPIGWRAMDGTRRASGALLAGGMSVALALGSPGPLAAQAGEGEVGPALGTPAPGAIVEDLDENEVELLDVVGGRPALLEFWATWCEKCKALQPQLDDLQARYGDRLRIVAVAVAVSQSLRRVKRHVEEHDPGYPFVWDARGNAVRAYNALTTSVIVMLDADGEVAYTGVGTEQDLVGAVEALLATGAR